MVEADWCSHSKVARSVRCCFFSVVRLLLPALRSAHCVVFRSGKSLFSRSAKTVEERRVGLVAYLKDLFAGYSHLLSDPIVSTFFNFHDRLLSEISIQVRCVTCYGVGTLFW